MSPRVTDYAMLRNSLRRRYYHAQRALERPDLFDRNEVHELIRKIVSQWSAEYPGENISDS
jgi:hypothetical protein